MTARRPRGPENLSSRERSALLFRKRYNSTKRNGFREKVISGGFLFSDFIQYVLHFLCWHSRHTNTRSYPTLWYLISDFPEKCSVIWTWKYFVILTRRDVASLRCSRGFSDPPPSPRHARICNSLQSQKPTVRKEHFIYKQATSVAIALTSLSWGPANSQSLGLESRFVFVYFSL